MSIEGGRRRTLWIVGFAALLAATGVVALVLDNALFQPTRLVGHLPFAILVVGFGAAEAFVVHFEIRENAHSFTLNEIPLVLGLFLIGRDELVLARLLGGLVVVAWVNRDAWLKTVFNAGLFSAEVSLLVLFFHALTNAAGTGPPPDMWLGALIAGLLVNWLSAVAIGGVTRLSGGSPTWVTVRNMIAMGTVSTLGTTSLALISVQVIDQDPRALVLVLIVALVLYAAYRAYAGLLQRYASLQQLHDFTRVLAASPELTTTIRSTLEQARELLRADMAELCLVRGGGPWADIRLRLADEPQLITEHSRDLAERDELVASVLRTRNPVLVADRTRDPEMRRLLSSRGVRDLLACPLVVGEETIGMIAVLDRIGDVSTFVEEDIRVFQTLADHATVSLENARLLDQLRVEAADKEHQALHDSLTGLGNRLLFQHCTDEALHERRIDEGRLAVLLLDLNRFKEVNDTLGHHQGDLLLRQVAERLSNAIPPEATITRLGGDEFAILLPRIRRISEAETMADTCQHELSRPFRVAGVDLGVSAAIGIASYPDHGEDVGMLLQHADIAMYAAKEARGNGIQVFSRTFDNDGTRRLSLAADLRKALDDGALSVHYQPVARLTDGEVVAVEALVRWEHPEHGWVPPEEVIPLADHLGLIGAVTRYVLDIALAQCRTWDDLGLSLQVAVNLSTQSLVDRSLTPAVERALSRAGVAPRQLILELTETQVIVKPDVTLEVLNQLHGLGVTLAVDDFGTGYSSLTYLARLPVDEIKIDKSFVQAMFTDEGAETIVRSVIDLGRNLGHRVVAEGVEDLVTWDALRALGCDLAQGFYLSRAITAPQLTTWLLGRSGNARLRAVPDTGRTAG